MGVSKLALAIKPAFDIQVLGRCQASVILKNSTITVSNYTTMSEFHFLRPLWLLALIPLAGLSWQMIKLGREGGDWRRVCDPALLPYILVHDSGGKPARRASWLFTLGGLLAILALAGPVWERLPVPAFRNEAALVIALDLSHIMEATDIKPSRLGRARYKIADLLKQRKDGLTALLVYSGDAFTVTPLTDDTGTINSQLSALTSDLMPVQGSRPELALELAGRLLKQAGLTRGDVLLITDGGSLGKAFDAAKKLNSQGYKVSVLGAGSEEGAPVPLPEGGFSLDNKGNIKISKLAEPALRQLAEDGGGIYRKLSIDNSDLSTLLPFLGQQGNPAQLGEEGKGTIIQQWEERGVWLLLLLLPIAALSFRRGYLAVLALLVLPLPETVKAMEWKDLWKTQDQQASEAFQQGDAAKAAESFANPAWKAAAQYKAEQFEEASKTLQGQESADAKYNLGNSLAKLGQYPQAIAAYDKALKLDPKHEDARYNKELVEKAMKEQQEQEKDKNQSGDQDQQQNKDQQQKKGDQQQGKDQKQDDQQKQQDQSKSKEDQQQQGQQDDQKSQDNQQDQAAQQGEQQKPEEKQSEDAQAMDQRPSDQQEEEKKAMESADMQKNEDNQAVEQWLRRIPDDPGGLLRRKFALQYQQRQNRQK